MGVYGLAALFSVVAFIYASVGFGGGSSYLALLVYWQVSYSIVPAIALICNIVVVSGNSFHYLRAGFFKPKLLLPFAAASVPFSYIGGNLMIEKHLFEQILFWVLLLSGIRLFFQYKIHENYSGEYKNIKTPFALLTGGALGFLAGITGIGGGIYLAPILYNLRAGSPKQIACASSLFILINSLAGLLGQLQKQAIGGALLEYWYLPVVVFIGGQLGNMMLLKFIPLRFAAMLTAVLVLGVATQLGFRIWG